ncbi:hypothetical protein ACWDTQ_22885 [Streptomyces cellulosae]|uniref:Uncharacterized protein n=1 Tax=Streptomyces cellulosae TaxID=1968 RepID=A0ABW6JLQ6_STRCE
MRERIISALRQPRALELLVFVPLCMLVPLIGGLASPDTSTWLRVVCAAVAAVVLFLFGTGMVLVMTGARGYVSRPAGPRPPRP